MILTLAWKEMREQRAVWFTMIFLTVLLGIGLGKIIDSSMPGGSINTAMLTILGLAAVYGIVCGGMMLAGEDEAGTLVFLDIFLGRRALLWFAKLGIGIVFVLTQAALVAAGLYFLRQPIPEWARGILGISRDRGLLAMPQARPDLGMWFLLIPVVTLEAFAWGLFGSALSRRVLSAAAIAAVGATPVWMIGVAAPAPVFLGFRIVAALIVLGVSVVVFVNSLGQTVLGTLAPPEDRRDRRREFLERWERVIQDDWERSGKLDPVPVTGPPPLPALVETEGEEAEQVETVRRLRRRHHVHDAGSPSSALWWLCFHQAWAVFLAVGAVCFFLGFLLPVGGQILWPVVTLLVGIACGTATFGAEQRDLSYQFLSSQHLPLVRVWSFKTLFWLGSAVLLVGLFLLGGGILVAGRILLEARPIQPGGRGFHFGTLHELMGSVLFFGIWLVYGYWAGHLFVWLCRKMLLALALSTVIGLGAIVLWLPSLLSRGMGGWQLWIAPLSMPFAAVLVLRAWAGGRIKERRPLLLLIAFAAANLLWVGLNYAYRAWEFSDVGEPMDRTAYRASIPTGLANLGGQKLQEAVAEFDAAPLREMDWLAKLEEANNLPLGILETPPGDGQSPLLRHLPMCLSLSRRLTDLSRLAQASGENERAFRYLDHIFLLSRALRNKAPLESYLVGCQIEEIALLQLEQWLGGKPAQAPLKIAHDCLARHKAETPSMLDCLQTECFRAGGALAHPNVWSYAVGSNRIPEQWLIGGVNLSLNLPWEAQRSERLWRMAWAGLFRNLQTPHWQLPRDADLIVGTREATKKVLRGWLPPADSSMNAVRLAAWLDDSWLADEKLFISLPPLRAAGTRSLFQVEAARIRVAMALYQAQEGRAAGRLDDLVPRYLPEAPIDLYTGGAFPFPPPARRPG